MGWMCRVAAGSKILVTRWWHDTVPFCCTISHRSSAQSPRSKRLPIFYELRVGDPSLHACMLHGPLPPWATHSSVSETRAVSHVAEPMWSASTRCHAGHHLISYCNCRITRTNYQRQKRTYERYNNRYVNCTHCTTQMTSAVHPHQILSIDYPRQYHSRNFYRVTSQLNEGRAILQLARTQLMRKNRIQKLYNAMFIWVKKPLKTSQAREPIAPLPTRLKGRWIGLCPRGKLTNTTNIYLWLRDHRSDLRHSAPKHTYMWASNPCYLGDRPQISNGAPNQRQLPQCSN
jgi:hypothetical protein